MLDLKPLAKERRHAVDYRDEIEHEETVKILSELPWDHRAVIAYYMGSRQAADGISLGHLLPDRMDLVARLGDAQSAATGRFAHGPNNFYNGTSRSSKPTA